MAVSNDNKFLSLTGLNKLWEKINNKFATKAVATTSADGLMSKTDKSNLNTLVNLKPAEAGAQVNKIEGVAIAGVGETSGTPTEMSNKIAVIRVTTDINTVTDAGDPLAIAGAKAVKDYVDDKVNNKNVTASGDEYVSATATGNKVTVSATTSLKSAINNANSAVQGATGDTYITATKSASNIITLSTNVGTSGSVLTTASTVDSKINAAVDNVTNAWKAGATATYTAAKEYTDNKLTSYGLTKALGTAAFTNSTAYATAAQGSKADTAVQTVSEGTYINVGVSGTTRTISAKTQNVSSASTSAKGLAEAYDVKTYVDTKIQDVTSLVTAATQFLGVSTTAITDGATAPTTVNGKTVGAGDIAMYGTSEFIWDGTKWVLLGDTTAEAAAIEELNRDLDALTTRVGTAESDINTLETKVSNLENGTNTVKTFAGKVGAITIDSATTTEGDVKFTMDGNTLTGAVNGWSDVSAKAKSAVQTVSGSDTITVTSSGTTRTISAVVNSVASATSTSKGLAKAYDVKDYVDTKLTDRINALDGTSSTADTPAPITSVATQVTQTNGVVSVVYTTFTAISDAEIEALV